jgi:hypothetical protein
MPIIFDERVTAIACLASFTRYFWAKDERDWPPRAPGRFHAGSVDAVFIGSRVCASNPLAGENIEIAGQNDHRLVAIISRESVPRAPNAGHIHKRPNDAYNNMAPARRQMSAMARTHEFRPRVGQTQFIMCHYEYKFEAAKSFMAYKSYISCAEDVQNATRRAHTMTRNDARRTPLRQSSCNSVQASRRD